MNSFDVITGICVFYMCFVVWNIDTAITKHSSWIHKKLELCVLLSIFIFYQTVILCVTSFAELTREFISAKSI